MATRNWLAVNAFGHPYPRSYGTAFTGYSKLYDCSIKKIPLCRVKFWGKKKGPPESQKVGDRARTQMEHHITESL